MTTGNTFTPKTTAEVTVLALSQDISTVRRMADDQTLISKDLPLGVDALVQQCLKHEPPWPIELEHAIEFTEEVVMPLAAQFAGGVVLRLEGQGAALIADALKASGIVQSRFSLDEIEALFNRLVAVSQGRPLSQEKLPTDSRLFAAVLILREFMHHLHFADANLPSAVHNIHD